MGVREVARMSNAPLIGVKACVFDAYGTLFDFASAARGCRDVLGDRCEFAFCPKMQETAPVFAALPSFTGRQSRAAVRLILYLF